ncbi:hypothetical protein [Streptomyces noursei]|uniref:hypothetical protein n=1 Tax=Streptomyces noursei TaxID=1971 RepID=UPI00167ADD66|nr:hypothetical protein [Streptomyces noursei]MCZ1021425.1 hypothetical protein [Streptomyces noursei]GGX46372.1 hypothetical protein GCM10010341_80120 [Streptomyces noursei]
MTTDVAAQAVAPTLESAIAFISLHATQEDLDRIYATAKQRSKALREARAASVAKGTLVRLGNIKPKYMDGLTGKVVEVRQGRSTTKVDIELDAESTDRLRMHRDNVPDDVERHRLNNVPASVCHPQ